MTLEDRFPIQDDRMAYCEEHGENYNQDFDCRSCMEEERGDILRDLAKDKKACL